MTGFVAPAYGERSLGDVLPAVAAAMGIPLGTSEAGLDGLGLRFGQSGLELPSAAAYVVFLVDGMGTNLLRRYAHAAPFLSSLSEDQEAGTAGVPSTTATSLTSFGTGLTPGGHGLVGYTSRIPGTEHLLNALQWRKDVDPVEWQPNQTVFQRLGEAGVPVTVINKRVFGGSGLTIAAHRGAEFVGADRVGERIASAVALSRVPGSLT